MWKFIFLEQEAFSRIHARLSCVMRPFSFFTTHSRAESMEEMSCQSRRHLQRLPPPLLLCIDFLAEALVTLTRFYGQDHEFATALLCST